jgi:hypothetical protein
MLSSYNSTCGLSIKTLTFQIDDEKWQEVSSKDEKGDKIWLGKKDGKTSIFVNSSSILSILSKKNSKCN